MTGKPRGDHQPEGSPDLPAGGSPGGSDANTRRVAGHEGETAAQATGSVIGRLRSAKGGGRAEHDTAQDDTAQHSTTRHSTAQDTTAPEGEGSPSQEREGALTGGRRAITDGSFQQTDSSRGEHARGRQGDSMVGRSGIADDLDFQGPRPEDVDRRRERRSELVVFFWFVVSIIATFVFVIVNFAGNSHKEYYTPVLGVSLAFAVSGLGIGLIHWAKRLMPDEEAVQEREPHHSKPEELEATQDTFVKGLDDFGFAKRPLLRRTLLAAGGALGLIAVVPVLNFGKLAGRSHADFKETAWKTEPGEPPKRLVTQDGIPVRLGDLAGGALLTVFPGKLKEGSTDEYEKPEVQTKADSTVILIRLRSDQQIKPAPGREDWTFDNHVAYSKICTHAGCPVSLYEQQTHHLLCPCHQSVFDVLDHARPIFGPAARPLPQLPIEVDEQGYFVARGDFPEPVGPSFWERG
ncbi:MAG: ubiquinol-cytochrome c reductase iron-sulfur subunit [Frankiaceae bacterium]|nr:ubiquinol-cytochrome c reductase iron-sulfur subunit [Frankiaceae bacterium]